MLTDKEKLEKIRELLKLLDEAVRSEELSHHVLFYNVGVFATQVADLTKSDEE